MDTSILPKDIVDKIMLQADIDALLNDDEDFEELNHFDPYSLSSVIPFYESIYNNSYKKLSRVSNPMRKSERMFVSEVTIIGMKGDKLSGLCLVDTPYIKVEIPDVDGEYYIKTDRLKQLLKEFTVSEYELSFENGVELINLLCIDRQLLLDNCERR